MQELRSVTETAELSGHTRSQAQRTQRSQAQQTLQSQICGILFFWQRFFLQFKETLLFHVYI